MQDAEHLSPYNSSCRKCVMPKKKRNREHRLQKLGTNLLLCIASVSIFLGGAELLARIWYNPQKAESEGGYEYDSEKMFRLKKNVAAEFFDVPYNTNSFGYRSPEIPIEKPKNTIRVLVLGDSVTFGLRVLDHETYPYKLEQKLNRYFQERGMRKTAEVINTAVPGNAPFQEYHDLKRGLALDPDIIILQLTLNDVIEVDRLWVLRVSGFTEKQLEEPDLEAYLFGEKPISLAFRMNYLLRQKSAFYLFLKDMYSRIRFRDISGENIASTAQQEEKVTLIEMINNPTHPQVTRAWKHALVWIEKITNLAREKNVPVILMFTPFNFQMEQEMRFAAPQRIMKEFAREQDIVYVDLLNTLQNDFASSTGEQLPAEQIIAETLRNNPERLREHWSKRFYDMVHARPSGHEFIANILKPVVLDTLQVLKKEGKEAATKTE